jgi:hypothetical protein
MISPATGEGLMKVFVVSSPSPARRPRSRSPVSSTGRNFVGPGSDDTEQEIHVWLKNTGTIHANYIHMSVIQE